MKGSHEHVVEVMRHMHVAVADWEGQCPLQLGGGGGTLQARPSSEAYLIHLYNCGVFVFGINNLIPNSL